MLLAGSEKKIKIMKDFVEVLEKKRIKFVVSDPYIQYRKNSAKLIWLISHEDRFQVLSHLKNSEENKFDYLSLFSTSKNLSLPELKN